MRPKYIAAGFLDDAEELLKDFIAENSVEFKVFASVWRKHYFSLIYMGRQNERELSEFTSEIFRISLPFLYSELSFLQNVGGVFLLYGLFRNQILNPPVKIRVLPSDFRNILRIRHIAAMEKYRSLHYVLDYMIINSFDFVGAPTLMGPLALKMPRMKKSTEKISHVEESIELAESKVLETINDLSKEIKELSESLPPSIASSSYGDFSETVDYLNAFVKTGCCSGDTQNSNKQNTQNSSSVSKDIGSRRTQIKAAAFEHQAAYHLEASNQKNAEEKHPTSPNKAMRHKARVPKHQRKVGRPRKNPKLESDKKSESESESNDESFLHIASDLLPSSFASEKKKREKPRRKFYYEE